MALLDQRGVIALETVRAFQHDGRSFEIKMIIDHEEWHLKVFVDGKPIQVDGFVSHGVQQDAGHYGIGDPRQVIVDALEEHIKGSHS